MRKGRAAASDDDEPRSDGGVNMDDIDDDVDIPATHRPPPRSRATLARRSAATNASASTSTSAPAPLFRARRPARPRAPRVSNAKAGKKPRRGRKFETHHFRCPVSDCGREHARVLVGPTKAEARWRAAELDPKTGVAGEVPLYIGA
ncbi:hypothetical protein DL93DRAFT_2082915 [Clavulina sp. PMI_390]|nr:hypothetical protein DL93DRAFT_2082915 [Clavulina sp. PMI_390]